MSDIEQRIEKLEAEGEALREKIRLKIEAQNDKTLRAVSNDLPALPKLDKTFKPRRILKGHLAKIHSMHWATNRHFLVSASQDGKMIVWNAVSTNKSHSIPMRCSWVMTCAFSPSSTFVACAGLDTTCTIYQLNNPQGTLIKELSEHSGYVSCCRFIDDGKILTASGDNNCILWDIETGKSLKSFNEHTGDVLGISLSPDKHTFCSGSSDLTAKLYDMRTGKSSHTFSGHDGTINTIQFFPDGNAFGTGSDDATCRLFDIRAAREVNKLSNESVSSGVTSVAFSKSGRLLFAGYDDFTCQIWDSMKGDRVGSLTGHENRVSCVGVTTDGMALCTGSWDTFLKVWA